MKNYKVLATGATGLLLQESETHLLLQTPGETNENPVNAWHLKETVEEINEAPAAPVVKKTVPAKKPVAVKKPVVKKNPGAIPL